MAERRRRSDGAHSPHRCPNRAAAAAGRCLSSGANVRPPSGSGPGDHRACPTDGRPRHDDREYRAAVGAKRAGFRHGKPSVDRHRVFAGLRCTVAQRRAAVRHRRQTADTAHRVGRVRRGIRRGWGRCRVRHAGCRARGSGRLRSNPRPCRAVHAQCDIHCRARTRPRARHLRRDRIRRRRGGTAVGRRTDRVAVVAVVSVREPALRRSCGRTRFPPRRLSPPRLDSSIGLACLRFRAGSSASCMGCPTPRPTHGPRR